jgi:UPF0716 protein FxsA
MRRRIPWWVLALLFIVLPIIEIYILIQIGQAIGAWWTILLLIADGFLGSWLMKREGRRAWAALRDAIDNRRMPARELADGALILVGGTLLLTPGFVSDVFGLFCVLPFTRPVARNALSRVIARRFLDGPGAPGYRSRATAGTGGPAGGRAGNRAEQRPGPDDVVRGEVVDEP